MNEVEYDERRLQDFVAGRARGFSRRDLLRLSAAAGVGTALAGISASPAAAATPIVKPLPPELFRALGTNAETRWSSLKDQGYYVPIDRFFVRNHTTTPIIDGATWSLSVFGSGLRGGPVQFSLADLRKLPSVTVSAAVECAGNGRSFFTSQQGQTVSGTAWTLGAVGVARWRGVKLSTVLRRAGISRHAVDVQPAGLDANFVSGGVDLGQVRRPFPVEKAFDDVILAYEMNGEELPADHGYPVRVIVPGWIGIASIKWVGSIEVSATPLFSPWNTQFYRLFGPSYPAEGQPFDTQVVKSAFELDAGTVFEAGVRTTLTGRSWSAHGPIRKVEVSVDGGATWKRARFYGATPGGVWQRWELTWKPEAGAHTLLARATDIHGNTQPDVTVHNTLGYLFDAVVKVPVTAA
ncbi:DMSO/TMAO reductase YedYZ molybdopterin-dependent catalytic subunit [Actinoplanes lutulentus]|uniref:DMSO/TMAO reductase YedYZ molybdopterin-dependent catalytic subunit n=1 Tax=Actinoplanes lutulentus TaxID=1287878 RepID=A0A327Z0W0_9ACTN|nr:sulfite oxidase [Actinoplanes lutulentus]MBB2948591.1 DMSO/TMAO reductase YedYZ molybdopterin-dependent catalytic subunit [Actinoplanes lutulentus]RAK28038.1 DMSO/TMAO reductase YedYZ molybdopterin-dependent catalytic subunit [Actinoplanes lutulentus]